jgi:hypothetical protein
MELNYHAFHVSSSNTEAHFARCVACKRAGWHPGHTTSHHRLAPVHAEELWSRYCAASSSFNWSADGLASLGVNSIHVDDAGCEVVEFSGSDSDAGSDCRSEPSGSGSGDFSDEQASYSPVSAAMRRKPLHTANASTVSQLPQVTHL